MGAIPRNTSQGYSFARIAPKGAPTVTVTLSIIIPVLNECDQIARTLDALAKFRHRGVEIIAVDGGSADGTADAAKNAGVKVITSPRGRAIQLNAGAAIATGDVLAFLHGDTQLPDNADGLITEALRDSTHQWGRFDTRFDSQKPMMRVVAAMMNFRSRITGVATGDQCIFVRKNAFNAVGGFPKIALMEDVALSKLLRAGSAPVCLRQTVTTSARRWDANGVWRTIFTMWWLRLAYVIGVAPDRLARWYGYR